MATHLRDGACGQKRRLREQLSRRCERSPQRTGRVGFMKASASETVGTSGKGSLPGRKRGYQRAVVMTERCGVGPGSESNGGARQRMAMKRIGIPAALVVVALAVLLVGGSTDDLGRVKGLIGPIDDLKALPAPRKESPSPSVDHSVASPSYVAKDTREVG